MNNFPLHSFISLHKMMALKRRHLLNIPKHVTHLMMLSESTRPSKLRFCSFSHRQRILWRSAVDTVQFDKSRCWILRTLIKKNKRRKVTKIALKPAPLSQIYLYTKSMQNLQKILLIPHNTWNSVLLELNYFLHVPRKNAGDYDNSLLYKTQTARAV